jgi:hypothetical protein
VKDAFGLIELKVLNTRHAAPAATVTAFSAYFIGLCIRLTLLKKQYQLILNQGSTISGYSAMQNHRTALWPGRMGRNAIQRRKNDK